MRNHFSQTDIFFIYDYKHPALLTSDAQLAAKQAAQEKEGRGRRGRSQIAVNSDGWNPWGQPGGGAPMRSSVDALSPRHSQVPQVVIKFIVCLM